MSPPISTIQLRWRAGMLSDTNEKMIGSMPPTPRPTMKHMAKLMG
jgi:hypothetical protein